MKKIRFILSLTAVTCALTMLSCDPIDHEEPETEKPETEEPETEKPESPEVPVAEKPNTYVINGTEYTFSSTATSMLGEDIMIAATPAEGYNDLMDIVTGRDEFFFGAMKPNLLDKEIDMMTETGVFTVYTTIAEAFIENVAPGATDEITLGICKMTKVENTVTFTAGIILADETTLAVNITAEAQATIEVNENKIGRRDEDKPLRASFYMEEDGLTYLYFTPSELLYFEEVAEMATWYYHMVVSDDLMTGKDIELSEIGEESTFKFGMVDNIDYEDYFDIDASDLGDTEGMFKIEKIDEGGYAVTLEIIHEGDMYWIEFEGESIHVDETAPEEDNAFAFGDDTFAIEAAALTKSEDVWTLCFTLENEENVYLNMPAGFYDGVAHGFSQSPDMSLTYGDTTYSKANGNSGTATVELDEEAGIIDVEFTNYDDCELYYIGEVTIK